jgi:protein gp37
MNRTGIEWCDYTWNPIVGCTHGCEFCYARRMAKRQKPGVRIEAADGAPHPYGCQDCYDFRPHLHAERLDQPQKVKSPRIVFCGSMGDLFDPELAAEDRQQVWHAMNDAWWHHYVVLTKRPDLIDAGEIREHCQSIVDAGCDGHLWLGVSVTCDADWWRVEELLEAAHPAGVLTTLISFEPLLGPIEHPIPAEIEWVIVGAQTGPGAEPMPYGWVCALRGKTMGIPLFEKDNLAGQPGRSRRRRGRGWPGATRTTSTRRAARDRADAPTSRWRAITPS